MVTGVGRLIVMVLAPPPAGSDCWNGICHDVGATKSRLKISKIGWPWYAMLSCRTTDPISSMSGAANRAGGLRAPTPVRLSMYRSLKYVLKAVASTFT